MCRRKDPPPGPAGRRCRLGRSKTSWLDVRSRRVTGHPVASGRRDIRATAWPPDQGRHGLLLLLLVVISDPNEPTVFRRLAALRRQRFRRRRIRRQWPFRRHSIFGGQGGTDPQRCPLADPSPQDSPY